MKKPKIVIADRDINYIIPLQLKIIEEFFEKIDLEIITDEDYFHDFFSTARELNVLIVSDELYDDSLRKHNISHIFLMSEQPIAEQKEESEVVEIYKYKSIIEIFSTIIGKCEDSLPVTRSESQKGTQVVMFYSAAGGVGRTTLAMGVAACLSQNYKRVLYINASWIHTFQFMLEDKSAITSYDVYAKLSYPGENIYSEIRSVLRQEEFTYIPPFKASLMSMGLGFGIYGKIIESAKKSEEYDLIIVDLDSGFNNDTVKLMDISDRVVIVTKQDTASVFATDKLATNVNGASTDKFIFVCNDFDKTAYNALVLPESKLKFKTTNYIKHIEDIEKNKVADIAQNKGVSELAFLLM